MKLLLSSTLLVVDTITSHAFTSSFVPRISLHEYLSSPTYDRPILIHDIASIATMDKLVDGIMTTCGDDWVSLQRKQKRDGRTSTEIYDVTLRESIEYMMDSNHDDAYFAFCEGMLSISETERSSIDELNQAIESIRDRPFPNQENWFDFFPNDAKPSDAIILAGTGSTSTLHRDPFEWTGTSLCLEGTKIWRFIYPPSKPQGGVSVIDDALNSYRLDSVAWEEDADSTVLSAGWQSDLSLYHSIEGKFPTAFEWMNREEENPVLFREELKENISMISPSPDSLDALNRISGITNDPTFATAIQQTGDLLIIPAHCWHQTYAPVPSIAIASQRCSANVDGANVVQHIISLSKNKSELPELLKQNKFAEGSGRDVTDALLRFAIE